MKFILTIIIIATMLAASYGMWQFGRKISYIFAYEDLVIETINERVKTECVLEIKE